ncbi:unnamed protein product [Xylocopa violacea]|uniref:Reverse transcriptase domain-containing protein n=1 Tax=Xylocopa violacea TaxID=135666 RepID=A0ABP1PH58_XYLVO
MTELRVKSLRCKSKTLDCCVTRDSDPPIIGRKWLAAFGLWPLDLEIEKDSSSEKYVETRSNASMWQMSLTSSIMKRNSNRVKDSKRTVRVILKPGTVLVTMKVRHAPLALREKIEKELMWLEGLGNIEKVDRAQKFSQIDLSHAYMQILVVKESREYLAIITLLGLCCYRKLSEGIASRLGDFQRKMETCLQSIENVAVYIDNMYKKSHVDNVTNVFERLQEYGFKVNKSKCELFKEELEILGFVIDKSGLHKARKRAGLREEEEEEEEETVEVAGKKRTPRKGEACLTRKRRGALHQFPERSPLLTTLKLKSGRLCSPWRDGDFTEPADRPEDPGGYLKGSVSLLLLPLAGSQDTPRLMCAQMEL